MVGDGGFPSSCSQDGTDPSPSPAYDLKTRILAAMISLAPQPDLLQVKVPEKKDAEDEEDNPLTKYFHSQL